MINRAEMEINIFSVIDKIFNFVASKTNDRNAAECNSHANK